MLTHENIVADVSATLLQLAEHKPHKVSFILNEFCILDDENKISCVWYYVYKCIR